MKYYEMILRFPEFKRRALTLSFDDGRIDDRKMVEIHSALYKRTVFLFVFA